MIGIQAKEAKSVSNSMYDGIMPVNWLEDIYKCISLVKDPMDDGNIPVNWFEDKENGVNFVNDPIDDGIVTVNLLEYIQIP